MQTQAHHNRLFLCMNMFSAMDTIQKRLIALLRGATGTQEIVLGRQEGNRIAYATQQAHRVVNSRENSRS